MGRHYAWALFLVLVVACLGTGCAAVKDFFAPAATSVATPSGSVATPLGDVVIVEGPSPAENVLEKIEKGAGLIAPWFPWATTVGAVAEILRRIFKTKREAGAIAATCYAVEAVRADPAAKALFSAASDAYAVKKNISKGFMVEFWNRVKVSIGLAPQVVK